MTTQTENRIASAWVRFTELFDRAPRSARPARRWPRRSAAVLGVLAIIYLGLSWYWSREPEPFWVTASTADTPLVAGYSTTDTLIRTVSLLLDKPGGYLRNDVFPPGLWLDNIPNWEFGVLVQARDLARVMRNDYSRSQSQSAEDRDLREAEPRLNFDANSWILPATEGEYRDALEYLAGFRARLVDADAQDAQFFARADNLREWLQMVEKRLGSLSQRLTASVGQARVNTDLAGDPAATKSTPRPGDVVVKTPWLEIDDIFFESRGAAWALIHFLRAAEFDFQEVLEKKNATVSLRQIIRELEASQQTLRSPIVLNGHGFGLFANHSLVMATYLARANAGVINLRELLEQG